MLTVRIRQRKPSLKKPRHAKTTTPQRPVAETGLRLPTKPPKTGQKRRQTRWRLKLLQNRQQPQPQSQMLRRKSRRPSGKQLFQSQRRLRRSPLDCRLKRLFELLSILLGRHGKIQNSRSRSEEHTSELQSLMRISYAVFCLKKKKTTT